MKKTLILKVDPGAPDKKAISQAADILKKGGLVAFPTETIYGLAVNAKNKKAVERLYEVKKRPRNKPFTVQVLDINAVEDMCGCKLTKEAAALADKFWPGPLTIVLRSKKGENIGFRIPKNFVALSLIREAGIPIFVPSANIGGNEPPKKAGDVLKELDGMIDLIIDGGPTDVGVESTVVDMTVTPARILREGAISREELSEYL